MYSFWRCGIRMINFHHYNSELFKKYGNSSLTNKCEFGLGRKLRINKRCWCIIQLLILRKLYKSVWSDQEIDIDEIILETSSLPTISPD